MLTAIRDRASGWIAYLIIFMISVPFALWGIDRFFEGGVDDRVAAVVNGEEIPVRDFLMQFQQQKRYIQSVLGGELPAQYSDEIIKADVIRSLVQNELIRQEVEKSGFQISDSILSREITQTPTFLDDGKFDANRYKTWLQSRRQSAAEFEGQMREQLRLTQFHDGILNSSFIPPGDKKRFQELNSQQREISYFTIMEPADKFKDGLSNEQIKAFYDKNLTQFQRPERVKVAYIEIHRQQIMGQIDVNEDDLKKIYDQESDQYTTKEQRKFRQILLKLPNGSPSSEQYTAEFAEKEKLVSKLEDQLRNGANFSDLAKQYSEDSETSSKGGELGVVTQNDLDETLGEAVFGLELKAISDPIATSLGIHIAQVEEIIPPEVKPFEEVRNDVEQEYRQRQAETRYFDLANNIQNTAFEQPDSLQASSDASGLEIKHSEWFSRSSGEGIGQQDKVREAAFSDSVLKQGRNSDVQEISDGYAVVIHLEDYEDAQARPLEEVKNDVRDILAAEQASKLVKEKGSQAVSRLRDGGAMESVAKEMSAELMAPGFVSRTDKKISDEINSKLFTMVKPADDKSTVDGLPLPNGGYVVIQLKSIKSGDVEDGDKANQQNLDSDYGTQEWQALVSDLESHAEIKISQDNLDSL